MDHNVTGRAILVRRTVEVVERGRLRAKDATGYRVSGMAFQAQGGHRRAHEHFGIVGAVGFMAALAPAQPDCGVFEHKGALLFGVALEANLVSREGGTELAAV